MTANPTDNAHDRPRYEGSTSRSLLAHAQAENSAAWVRLVNLYAPLAANWCRRWRVPDQDIVDVLQDTFAAVATNLARFHKDEPHGTFRGWLRTITYSKTIDYFRRRTDRPTAAGGTEASMRLAQIPDPQTIADFPDDTDDDPALTETLHRALTGIRPEFQEKTWQAFTRTVIEGRPAADVAAELKMQPGAVRVAKSRVLKRLRLELGDRLD
jgi:RNA polymerase sigma-70 factor (ECF subfamily)